MDADLSTKTANGSVASAMMLTRPNDLGDADIASALRDGWGITADRVAYAPVGFGSHHWLVDDGDRRWFATVDDLDVRRRSADEPRWQAAQRLAAALETARFLRDDRGLSFVIAPLATGSGELLQPIGTRYVLAVYPWIQATAHEFGPYPSHEERAAVVDLLVAVHGATGSVSDRTRPAAPAILDDRLIPHRAGLEASLDPGSVRWGPGPYADRARRLVEHHATPLHDILARYDDLSAAVAKRSAPPVITHGEPHRANTMRTANGTMLIDWDTALLAPPERDLWMLLAEDPSVADRYESAAGIDLDPIAVDLYRLWWDLCEISLFSAEFRRAHADTDEARIGWQGLVDHLDPARWSDLIDG
jgi:spectinomycin phosphotransferase/16S rRNA (guanine(1405)-N(7))-methyltransferase